MGSGLGIIDEEALNIYTDGSSYPNRQRAAGIGVRFVWVNDVGDEEYEDYAPIGWEKATIDEMEIEACVVALKEAQRIFPNLGDFKRILMFSDSMYVTENFIKAMKVWPTRRWCGSNNMPVKNIELWKKLRKEVNKVPIRVDIEWVKGHKQNIHNRAADKLAKESASMPFNKPVMHSETTKKWTDRKTVRGCVPVHGQVIKIRIVSWEYLKEAKTYEYRYEVIDKNDKSFKDLDFVYFDEALSRNKCFEIRLNTDKSKPYIVELLSDLDPEDYKYEQDDDS